MTNLNADDLVNGHGLAPADITDALERINLIPEDAQNRDEVVTALRAYSGMMVRFMKARARERKTTVKKMAYAAVQGAASDTYEAVRKMEPTEFRDLITPDDPKAKKTVTPRSGVGLGAHGACDHDKTPKARQACRQERARTAATADRIEASKWSTRRSSPTCSEPATIGGSRCSWSPVAR